MSTINYSRFVGMLTPSRLIGLAVVLCILGNPTHAQDNSAWLYTVERPVESQSVAARNAAAAEGLLEVLSRTTGLVSVPRTPAVVAALARPDAYYNQFVFFTHASPEGDELDYVRVSFETSAIQSLVEEAALPVWWSQRPKVMMWLVLDDSGNRDILSATNRHPLAEAVKQRARQRGIEVVLPLMDLDDTLAISTADIWGKIGQTLDGAAQRYDADVVMVGRASVSRRTGDLTFRGDWEVWLDERPLAANFADIDAAAAARMGIDLLVDQLAEQFAVLPRAPRIQRLAVGGVNSPASYAQLMRYLSGLEFIDSVDVAAIDASTLTLRVTSRAEVSQLLMLLTSNGRLIEDNFHQGPNVRLRWQG